MARRVHSECQRFTRKTSIRVSINLSLLWLLTLFIFIISLSSYTSFYPSINLSIYPFFIHSSIYHSFIHPSIYYIFIHPLFSLQNATLKAQEKLKKSTEEKYEKVKDINEKKIELRCGEVQRKTEVIHSIFWKFHIPSNLGIVESADCIAWSEDPQNVCQSADTCAYCSHQKLNWLCLRFSQCDYHSDRTCRITFM